MIESTDFERRLEKEVNEIIEKYTTKVPIHDIYDKCVENCAFDIKVSIPEKFNEIAILKRIKKYWDEKKLLLHYVNHQKKFFLGILNDKALDIYKKSVEYIISCVTKEISQKKIEDKYPEFVENPDDFAEIMEFNILLIYQLDNIPEVIIKYWSDKGYDCICEKEEPTEKFYSSHKYKLKLKPKKVGLVKEYLK